MEGHDKAPLPELELEKLLWQLSPGKRVIFTPTGYQVYDWVKSHTETSVIEVEVGETAYTLIVPAHELISSSIDLSASETSYASPDTNGVIEGEEYRLWNESLISLEDIRMAAVKEVERRAREGDTETIPCTSCENKSGVRTCTCTEGGQVTENMVEHTTVSLREKGVPDPHCKVCGSEGKYLNLDDCRYCGGSGKIAKYPNIILINELTGERRVLKLDLCTLIATGDVKAEQREEKTVSAGYRHAEKIFYFELSDYIDRNVAEMGINKSNAVRSYGKRLFTIPTEYFHEVGMWAHWTEKESKVSKGFFRGDERMTAIDLLKETQYSLSRDGARISEAVNKLKNDRGVVVGQEWVMSPLLRSFEDVLEDIKIRLSERHRLLGFIISEEGVASFCVLNEKGDILRELGSDNHSARVAIENAWLTLQRLYAPTDNRG